MEPVFTSTNITKRFGQTIALNNVDIAIYPGEIRGFIGENGSGKSTMAQIMTGVYEMTSGSMYFHGEPWKPASMIEALKGGIGIIVQENGTIPEISVAENMFLGEMAAFSGVNFFEDKKVENFSLDLDKSLLAELDFIFSQAKGEAIQLKTSGEDLYYLKKKEYRSVRRDKAISKDRKTALLKEISAEMEAAKREMHANAKPLAALRKKYVKDLQDALVRAQQKLAEENKEKLAAFVASYNSRADEFFASFTAKTKETEKKYEGLLAQHPDDKYEQRRRDNDLKEIRKEYAGEIKRLDQEHVAFMQRIKGDVTSLTNHCKNCVRELTKHNDGALPARLRRGIITGIFGAFVNRGKLNKYAQLALNRIGINHIYAKVPCGAYDMQDRKLIEIAKCLNKSPEIFIVDETTTALSETGRKLLYDCMEALKREGKSVLFVSHDLDEIMEKCDTLTVLRDGNIVANLDKSKGEFIPDVILKAMIGRELKGDYYRSDWDGSYSDQVVLRMKDGIEGKDLSHIDLELHKGEILGIGGLSECGMHTLGKALFGNVKLEGGFVYGGENADRLITNEVVAMNSHIGYLPKNRDTEGLTQKDSIFNNIAIASLNNIARLNIFVFKGDEKKVVSRQVKDLSIKCNSPQDLVSSLSGGNKQKVSLGKWIGNDSEVLILDCPTRGVDIGVKQFIYQLLYRMKQEGKSIIMISEELPELIGMSDRIIIMKDGRISHEFLRSPDLTQEEIVRYMI